MKKTAKYLSLLSASLLLAACGNGEDTADDATQDDQTIEEVEETENTDDGSTDEESEEAQESSDQAFSDQYDDWPETVSFAFAGAEGQEELSRRFTELKDYFSENLDTEFEFFSLSDRTVSSTALEYDQVDLVLSGPSEYVLSKEASPDIEIAGVLERDNYHVVFIASEESGIESLDDAVGETIAMKDTGSTSGHIGPSAVLIEEGYDLDEDFDIQFLGDNSLNALLAGQVPVMADGVRHWNDLVAEGHEDDFNLIYEGDTLPGDPFILNTTLPESFRVEFSDFLMANADEVVEVILDGEDNDHYEGGQIIEADDSYYDSLREAYDVLGLEFEE